MNNKEICQPGDLLLNPQGLVYDNVDNARINDRRCGTPGPQLAQAAFYDKSSQ